MTLRMKTKNAVIGVPTLPCDEAAAHYERRLALETDCWDVHAALQLEDPQFVLVDVRAKEFFNKGHISQAINIPRADLTESRLAEYDQNTLFVVYCAGPHCNAATKAAAKLCRMGRRVKEMIGGATGWLDEGFQLESELASESP